MFYNEYSRFFISIFVGLVIIYLQKQFRIRVPNNYSWSIFVFGESLLSVFIYLFIYIIYICSVRAEQNWLYWNPKQLFSLVLLLLLSLLLLHCIECSMTDMLSSLSIYLSIYVYIHIYTYNVYIYIYIYV